MSRARSVAGRAYETARSSAARFYRLTPSPYFQPWVTGPYSVKSSVVPTRTKLSHHRPTPLPRPLGKQQWHAQFDAGNAVGGVLEGGLVAFQELAGFVIAVGRVVRRKHLEGAVLEPAPHRFLRGMVARRRAAAEFGALQIHA